MNSATALHVFLGVLIVGTVWRLSSYHLAASDNESVAHLGKAMAFQY